MDATRTHHGEAPITQHYGTGADLLAVLDEKSITDRQAVTLGLLKRISTDDHGPLRHTLLGVLDVAIADSILADMNVTAAPVDHTMRHVRLLWERRTDAEDRIMSNASLVRPRDLATLFDCVEREAQSAGLH